jgi:hypothetical protein
VDTDIDETRQVVEFAKKLEVLSGGEAGALKLAEFNPLDGEEVSGVLKRGARVVLVVGDQVGGLAHGGRSTRRDLMPGLVAGLCLLLSLEHAVCNAAQPRCTLPGWRPPPRLACVRRRA